MNSADVNNRLMTGVKAERMRESSTFADKLKLMRRIKKSEKQRSNILSVHSDKVTDAYSKEANASSDVVTTKLAESQHKITKSLTEENDNLRNKNTTLRYQVELLSEQINDLRDANMDLRSQNSRIREENSILRNEHSQLTARNECLVEQIILLQKMLEDMGVSMDEEGGCGLKVNLDLPTEFVDDVAREEDTVSYNGNPNTPASYRKPPPSCDSNLDFL